MKSRCFIELSDCQSHPPRVYTLSPGGSPESPQRQWRYHGPMHPNRSKLPEYLASGVQRRLCLRWLAACALLPGVAAAASHPPQGAGWPRHRPVPGGVARVALGPADVRPLAFDGPTPLLVLGQAPEWHAWVGIALSAEPGEHHIAWHPQGEAPRTAPFTVWPHRYPEQQLRVAPRTVDLSPEDLSRHQREREHQQQVTNRFSEAPASWFASPEALRMAVPVAGRLSSPFGARRVFNGQARQPHSGIDLAAPHGTSVQAPLDAEVIDLGDYFFNGLTVWLDHGAGLLSMLCHLSEITVQPGDRLTQGQPLGAVGATGRATGPHLHWSVMLNRQMVDPTLFLPG